MKRSPLEITRWTWWTTGIGSLSQMPSLQLGRPRLPWYCRSSNENEYDKTKTQTRRGRSGSEQRHLYVAASTLFYLQDRYPYICTVPPSEGVVLTRLLYTYSMYIYTVSQLSDRPIDIQYQTRTVWHNSRISPTILDYTCTFTLLHTSICIHL